MGVGDDIIAFARAFSRTDPNGTEKDDLLGAFGLVGDDADEFLVAFAERFEVDMSPLRWEFHYEANEPPPLIRRVLPIDEHGNVIPFQPIRLADLVAAVEAGRWSYEYPAYDIRYSLMSYIWPGACIFLIVVTLGLMIF